MRPGDFWSIGDYAIVGELWREPGRALARTLDVAGRDVVDIATGTGVTAIAVARAGARSVTGLDAAPKLLAAAASRSQVEQLDIGWIEADLGSIPLPDQSADLVVSTFGIIFAEDPSIAIAECRRLVRPGGHIVFTSWSGSGLFGSIRRALSPYFPDAPEPWHEHPDDILRVTGDDATVEEWSFELTVASPESFVDQLERHSAPFVVAVETLGDRWPLARADLLAVVAGAGDTDGDGYRAGVDYLVTTIPGPSATRLPDG